MLRAGMVAFVSALTLLACAGSADTTSTAHRATVGAYYFDGWTSQTNHLKPRLKTDFADRKPVWGWRDDSPEVIRQSIDYAADADLSFFAFDWYYPEGSVKESPLNNALDLYLKAPNRDRLKFCLLVANHGGFRIGPADWDKVCAKWIELFKNPQHLTCDGKPLIIFFSAGELLKAFGDAPAVAKAFDTLRDKARAAGLPGVTVATCCTPGPEYKWSDLNQLAAAGFDVFTGYNYHGHPYKGDQFIQPFGRMVEGHIDIWNRFAAKNVRPYIPAVTTGWDQRPWEDQDTTQAKSVYYPDRTPQQVGSFVDSAIRWIDAHPQNAVRERMVLLYAWNENGEGGFLTPTAGYENAYLEAVKAAIASTK